MSHAEEVAETPDYITCTTPPVDAPEITIQTEVAVATSNSAIFMKDSLIIDDVGYESQVPYTEILVSNMAGYSQHIDDSNPKTNLSESNKRGISGRWNMSELVEHCQLFDKNHFKTDQSGSGKTGIVLKSDPVDIKPKSSDSLTNGRISQSTSQINLLRDSPFERWSPRYHLSKSPNWVFRDITSSNPLSKLSPLYTEAERRALIEKAFNSPNKANSPLDPLQVVQPAKSIPRYQPKFGPKIEVTVGLYEPSLAFLAAMPEKERAYYATLLEPCYLCGSYFEVFYKADKTELRWWKGRYDTACCGIEPRQVRNTQIYSSAQSSALRWQNARYEMVIPLIAHKLKGLVDGYWKEYTFYNKNYDL
jgi:hypothetical protein